MWRILPWSCSSLKAPSWSASGHLRVDAVQLDQVDPVDLQVPQRELDLLGQVRGAAAPPSRCRDPAGEAGLRGDDEAVRRTGAAPRR